MSHRSLAGLLIVIALPWLVPVSVAGQNTQDVPQTTWGDPNLQGVWNNNISTPLERPEEFVGKAFLTPEELAAYTQRRQASREDRDSRDGRGTEADVRRAYNALWFPVPGEAISRTSLIREPQDGKIPPLTAAGQRRADARRGFRRGPPAGPEDRSLWERCITRGVPRTPGGYNNHFQFFQTPDHVVILIEMVHEARIIPLDGSPHLNSMVGQWLGDSRGRWEGDTLVVETTNFTDKTNFRGSGKGLHLVERFTRIDADTLNYEFTVEDPMTWTSSWTAAWPLTSLQSAVGGLDQVEVPEVFEYACHEGNYGLVGQLGGARAEERDAADHSSR